MQKQGTDLERIVEIIERSIDPTAKVEHNVMLPVLVSNEGHAAQCDIVITKGEKPRQSITIVEVQDRKSKVDINTFRGWLGKLNDVGAQQLIVVSRKDFPTSIIEQVAQTGNKVFLITLKTLDHDKIPLDFIRMNFMYVSIDITSIKNVRNILKKGTIKYNDLKPGPQSSDDKVWSFDQKNNHSIIEILRKRIDSVLPLDKRESFKKKGKESITYANYPIDIFYDTGFNYVKTTFLCDYEWEYHNEIIPMSVASYQQEGHDLAWVFETKYNTALGQKIDIKIPIKRHENGGFETLPHIISTDLKDFELSMLELKEL